MQHFCIDLAADNPLDNAELYGIIDTLELLWNKFGEVFFETDPQKKVSLEFTIYVIRRNHYEYSKYSISTHQQPSVQAIDYSFLDK